MQYSRATRVAPWFRYDWAGWMGFGTIPDCTGLDHDDFIDPGADIEIDFERIGTLGCRFAEPVGVLLRHRISG